MADVLVPSWDRVPASRSRVTIRRTASSKGRWAIASAYCAG